MTRARTGSKAPTPTGAPDLLAHLRDDTAPDLETGTGTTPPTQQDGLEYLHAAESLEEAVNLALIQSTPETMDAIGKELLIYITGQAAPVGTVQVPEVIHVDGLVTQDEQDETRNRMIEAWHNDTVGQGILHKGGVCGCRYLAVCALRVTMPVLLDSDPEPQED